MNLQEICDHKICFTWVNICWPGLTSDYMVLVTSNLCGKLEDGDGLLLERKLIDGDNAYVKKKYMLVPHKSIVSLYDDANNFYVSQLQITIGASLGNYQETDECADGEGGPLGDGFVSIL